MRERNLGEKRIEFAAKMDPLHLPVGLTCGPTLQPLQRGSPPALSLSPTCSHPYSPLTPPLHFFSNPSSREGLKVCIWHHCILELISYSSIQFIFVFSKDSNRIWCLLLFLVKAQGTPEFFDFPPFPPLPGGHPTPQASWVSLLGSPWQEFLVWLTDFEF